LFGLATVDHPQSSPGGDPQEQEESGNRHCDGQYALHDREDGESNGEPADCYGTCSDSQHDDDQADGPGPDMI